MIELCSTHFTAQTEQCFKNTITPKGINRQKSQKSEKQIVVIFWNIFKTWICVCPLIYQIHKINSYSNETSELNSLVIQLQKVPNVKVWQLVLESIFEFNSSVLEKLFFKDTYILLTKKIQRLKYSEMGNSCIFCHLII